MDRYSEAAPKAATTATKRTTRTQAAKPSSKAAKPVTRTSKAKTPAKAAKTANSVERRKPGRPSKYTPEIAAEICAGIAEGNSLRKVLQQPGMPSMSMFMRWLADEDNAMLREQYACARDARADVLAEEIIEIADDGRNDTYVDDDGKAHVDHDHIARSRLRVDARKWLASKMAPKKYGDKQQHEVTGANGGAIQVASTVTFVEPKRYSEDSDE